MRQVVLAFFSAVVMNACSQPPGAAPPSGIGDKDTGLSSNQQADWAKIVQLEDQAKSIVRRDGCSSTADCNSAPVGSRACGGPRYYLVYCARTTDTIALKQKLGEVAAAERAYNTRYQIASTCEFRMPPKVGLVGQTCQDQ
jgi:hypothetical protein